MADKEATPKEVEAVSETVEKVEEKEKVEKVKEDKVQKDDKPEESTENGDVEEKENGEEKTEDDVTDKVCNVKRKSVSGDAQKDGATEGTPEKKAKLDETTEAESNGESEVAA